MFTQPKQLLDIGATHQALEMFIESVVAQMSSDPKFASALPAITDSRLPLNPEFVLPLSDDHWVLSPTYVDDQTRTPRGTHAASEIAADIGTA